MGAQGLFLRQQRKATANPLIQAGNTLAVSIAAKVLAQGLQPAFA
jgi:hypothetical protein